MNLLAPGALAMLALAIPILLLYMLKLRRQDALVSSSLLWLQLLRDRQSNTPWQRIKRQLLLFLQLLILAALVLALVRPALPVPSLASGPAVIVLDGSASMNATDIAPNRFAAARAAALEVVGNLPDGAPASIILAGVQPRLLASNETDRAVLRRALEAAQPDQGSADWAAAFSLAAAAVSSFGAAAETDPSQRPPILLISDGGIQAAGLPGLPGEVRYLPIGQSDENLAIKGLAARPSGKGAQLFIGLHNYGAQPRSAILSLYNGEALFDARQVDVPGNADLNVVLDELPEGASRITARLSSPQGAKSLDAFAADDRAYTVYRPASGGRVLLATRGNLFLRRLLESLLGIQAAVVLPGVDGKIEIPESGYDVTVLDGILPEKLPPGQLLIINPPENNLFTVSGSFPVTGSPRVARHALTQFVLWDNVHVRAAQKVTLPAWATALVEADGGPLVFAGETLVDNQRRRVAVISFDLHDSDLPLQLAFPVLVSNLLEYLSPSSSFSVGGERERLPGMQADGVSVRVGQSVLIRPARETDEVRVSDPRGQVHQLKPQEGRTLFNQTGMTGIYNVDDGQAGEAFAVNLFSPAESDIRPRPVVQIGAASVPPTARAALGQREIWPWAAGLALLVLMVEWWVFHRQQQVGPLLPTGLRERFLLMLRRLRPARREE